MLAMSPSLAAPGSVVRSSRPSMSSQLQCKSSLLSLPTPGSPQGAWHATSRPSSTNAAAFTSSVQVNVCIAVGSHSHNWLQPLAMSQEKDVADSWMAPEGQVLSMCLAVLIVWPARAAMQPGPATGQR